MKIKKITLLNFGSIRTGPEEGYEDSLSPTGYFLETENITFVNKTNILPAVKGLKFGIEYYVEGNNTNHTRAIVCSKIFHPQMHNPKTKKIFAKIIDYKKVVLNDTDFDYLFLEYDWEVQVGTYLFQILEDDQVLLEKSFELV